MDTRQKIIQMKTETHPCYTSGASEYARIHLPVAPKCNVSCNYCVRKFDCPNESRPGVTTQVLSPDEAVERYIQMRSKVHKLTVVGIAGPGDALANFPQTAETLRRIREIDADVTFCLSTNGLMLAEYAQQLIDLGVTHVTVTVNAVDPSIGARIYKYVDYKGRRYSGEKGAALLLQNQIAGIKYLTTHGVVCKVNIVILKGINEKHIIEVAKKVRKIGVSMTNIMKHIPLEGSEFALLPMAQREEIHSIRKECESIIKQMYHCRQCRSDAVGTLENDLSNRLHDCKWNDVG